MQAKRRPQQPAQLAHALYFYLPEGSSKCFIEEVPPETLFVGNYKNPDFVPFGSTAFTGSVCAQGYPHVRELLRHLGDRVPVPRAGGGDQRACEAHESTRHGGR